MNKIDIEKLKVGDDLMASVALRINHKEALIIGKSYEIKSMGQNWIAIDSEYTNDHWFTIDGLDAYFTSAPAKPLEPIVTQTQQPTDMIVFKTKFNETARLIHQGNVDKGFYDTPPNNATALMLVVSELSEAVEADRAGKHAITSYFVSRKEEIEKSKGQELDNEEYQRLFKTTMKDTYEDEIADAIIRLLDHCAYRKIDIDAHIAAKIKYNQSRPHKHGKDY
jgi:hypothetical protein